MNKHLVTALILSLATLVVALDNSPLSSRPTATPVPLSLPATPTSSETVETFEPFIRPVYEVASQVERQEIPLTDKIRLQRFELHPFLSQFELTDEPFGGSGFVLLPTYSASYDARWKYWERCEQAFPLLVPQLTEALQHYVALSGKDELLQYVESPAQVSQLLHADPALMNALMPLPQEWPLLSDADYQTYMHWIVSCIGVSFPVFEVEIENLTDADLEVTQILYRVSKIDQVMGGEYGPLVSQAAYVHEIDWITGDQAASLVPPLELPSQSTTSFLMGITTIHPDWGLCWLMRVYFIIDRQSGGVHTDEFQLIMSGLPIP